MNDAIIRLQDYALNNFNPNLEEQSVFGGVGTIGDLAELQKAMFAGDITGRDTENQGATGAEVLKVESLENTLVTLTETLQDVKLWKVVPKKPAFNTVEEYNQLVGFGQEGNSFNNEGELPDESDNEYARKHALVKFMGTTRSVSHPAQLVNVMVSSLMQEQQEKGTLKILSDADRAIVYGDDTIVPQEFPGLYKLQKNAFVSLSTWYDSDNVVDMKGKALTEEAIQNAALTIIENNGIGKALWMPPAIKSNFVQRFNTFKLIQPLTPAQNPGQAGQNIDGFVGPFGEMGLEWDKFMRRLKGKHKTLGSPATNTKAPTKPVADATTPKAAVTDAGNKFATAHAGDYYYAVSALNRHGESQLTNLATSGSPNAKLTIASTESADLIFTDGGGAIAATGYRVYRSEKSETSTTAAGAKFYPIFDVSVSELAAGYDGAAATKVRDRNREIPNTESCFMIDTLTETWRMKQLAPLMRMDLPPLGPASRFMILMYLTFILGAPLKFVRFINVGNDLT